MPVGVKRTGYRKYKSDPLCYNEPCDKENPDYAFPLDMFERMK